MAVSLEVLGDTAIEYPDGGVLTEEAKSRRITKTAIGDHSVDLWKTLHNWVDAAVRGDLDPSRTEFRLYVSRAVTSDLPSLMHDASTAAQSAAVLRQIRARLGVTIESDGRTAISSKVPRGLQSHLKALFAAPANVLESIISNFSLEIGSGKPTDDLKRELSTHLSVPHEIADEVLLTLMGWVKLQIDSQIDRGEPPRVQREDFRMALHNAVRRLDQERVLRSVAREPSDEEAREHLKYRTYVEQLSIIGLEYEEQLRAVTSFIQAEVNRTEWSERGLIFEDDLDKFQESLISTWRAQKRKCDIIHKAQPASERGQLLYTECSQHRTKLGGAELPEHFCPGSFHKLADSPASGPVIGWHPQYKRLLTRGRARSTKSLDEGSAAARKDPGGQGRGGKRGPRRS